MAASKKSCYVSLDTKNCIVCGKEAVCWTGHVVMNPGTNGATHVLAGWCHEKGGLCKNYYDPINKTVYSGNCDLASYMKFTYILYKAKSTFYGKYGNWKPEDGLLITVITTDDKGNNKQIDKNIDF